MEQDFWISKYENNQTGWDIGKISNPIKNYVDQLENKNLKILIPGCGFGHEAKYLFENGFKQVWILDFSIHAIEVFKENNPNFPKEHILHQDFFTFEVGEYEKFDLIIEQTLFCAIHPKMRDLYIKKVYELLKPSGKLVGLLFNREFPDKDYPPFGGNIEIYRKQFESVFTNSKIDYCYNSISERENTELFIKMIK
jgi:methyl halide transferase